MYIYIWSCIGKCAPWCTCFLFLNLWGGGGGTFDIVSPICKIVGGGGGTRPPVPPGFAPMVVFHICFVFDNVNIYKIRRKNIHAKNWSMHIFETALITMIYFLQDFKRACQTDAQIIDSLEILTVQPPPSVSMSQYTWKVRGLWPSSRYTLYSPLEV